MKTIFAIAIVALVALLFPNLPVYAQWMAVKLPAPSLAVNGVELSGPDEGVIEFAGAGTPRIAAGETHSLAIKSDGTLWAWGFNRDGELGDDTTIGKNFPVQVSGSPIVTT